jgi:hypothetical protein
VARSVTEALVRRHLSHHASSDRVDPLVRTRSHAATRKRALAAGTAAIVLGPDTGSRTHEPVPERAAATSR